MSTEITYTTQYLFVWVDVYVYVQDMQYCGSLNAGRHDATYSP